MQTELREKVCRANIELQKQKLVIYNWGNVSGIDRDSGIVIIKPSGVDYDELTPGKLVAAWPRPAKVYIYNKLI